MSATFWVHKSSGTIYRFVALARSPSNSEKFSVVYSATKPTIHRGELGGLQGILPKGTCWVRDSEDFFLKFQPLSKKT